MEFAALPHSSVYLPIPYHQRAIPVQSTLFYGQHDFETWQHRNIWLRSYSPFLNRVYAILDRFFQSRIQVIQLCVLNSQCPFENLLPDRGSSGNGMFVTGRYFHRRALQLLANEKAFVTTKRQIRSLRVRSHTISHYASTASPSRIVNLVELTRFHRLHLLELRNSGWELLTSCS